MTIFHFGGSSSIVKTRLPSHFARSGHIYATRLYKRLTLGDQADKYVWPQNQVLIYNVHSIQFNNVLRFIIAYKTGHHNIKGTILLQGKVHIIRTKYLRTVDSSHMWLFYLSLTSR